MLPVAWLVVAVYAAIFIVTWKVLPRSPSYRRIHRLERHLGYRDLTEIPGRRPRRRVRH